MVEQTYLKSINDSIRNLEIEIHRIAESDFPDHSYKMGLLDIYRLRIDSLQQYKHLIKNLLKSI